MKTQQRKPKKTQLIRGLGRCKDVKVFSNGVIVFK
jgi:hypothetical protein